MNESYSGNLPASFVKKKKKKYLALIASDNTPQVFIDDTLLKEVSLFANTAKVTVSDVELIIDNAHAYCMYFGEYNGFEIHIVNADARVSDLERYKSIIDICDKVILFNDASNVLHEAIEYANSTKTPCLLFRIPE